MFYIIGNSRYCRESEAQKFEPGEGRDPSEAMPHIP